ncbi:MAG: tetratricopeptide repeat protein [Acidobacteriaceae bacterium]
MPNSSRFSGCWLLMMCGFAALGNARAEQTTPAQQRVQQAAEKQRSGSTSLPGVATCLGRDTLSSASLVASARFSAACQAARRQITAQPKQAEPYNNLALALLARSRETGLPEYDRQAADAIAAGFAIAPQDFPLRRTHVALLLDQREFTQALEEASDLNLHNPDDATVRGYMAQADIGLGKYEDAEAPTQWMLNLQPFNVPGLLIAADIRNHYGDAEGALDFLRRAYGETSPDETGELALIANRIAAIEIETGKMEDAAQMLQRAEEVFPGYPDTAGNRARVHPGAHAATTTAAMQPAAAVAKTMGQGSLEKPTYTPVAAFSPVPALLMIPRATGTQRIITNMQARVERNPKDPSAYSALGAAFFQKARETGDVEDFQLAEQALNRSLDLESAAFSADAAYSSMAEVCMGEHRFSDAITYAQKALALGSGDVSSFAIVGDANADMGEYARAAVAYSRLDVAGDSRADPHTVYVRDSRTSYLRFVGGDTVGAITLMQSAVAAGTEARLPAENLAWLYFELGEYEMQAGNIAAANTAYLTALTIHPGDYRALAALGKLRGNQGRYAEAIRLYQSAVAVVPMPMYVAELGDLYMQSGNAAEATKQYQLVQYIGLLGNINQVLHNRDLALFYADHDIKLDEALALAHKEFEVRHDIYTWDALAWALYKNGKYQEASDAMENALRPGVQDALLFFHAGMIAGKLGQTTLARGRLQQALNINPKFHVIYAAVANEQLKALRAPAAFTASEGITHVP